MKNIIDTAAENEATSSEFQIENGQQLDLSFVGGTRSSATFYREQMMRSRAKGWFDFMHRVVDAAVEWKPAPPARPEQTALDLRRATEVHLIK